VSEFNQMGIVLSNSKYNKIPLVVESAPQFTPGAFYLRHGGPICYRRGFEKWGNCEIKSNRKLIIANSFQEEKLDRVLYLGRAWNLRLSDLPDAN